MNYSEIEKSLTNRQPIRLYEFRRGALSWLYNTSEQPIKRKNMLFKALIGGIKDGGIITSDGGQSDNFTITAPATIEIARLFLTMPPSSRISITVYNTHAGTDEFIQRWYGAVIGVNYSAIDSVKITCQSIDALTNKPGATEVYSRQCNAVIYKGKCMVNKIDYKMIGKIIKITRTNIEVVEATSRPDGWFNGGFFEYSIGDGESDSRYIESHVGQVLTVWGNTSGLQLGQMINLYPGCNLTADHCLNKFNNLLNRQSFEHIQGRSPFDGNPVGW